MTTGTVMIVGASRGIGLALALQYAAAGWRVHATTRSPEPPAALAGLEALVHRLDVTDTSERGALARSLGDEAIDVLVHNAGVMGKEADRERLLEVNARAPIETVEALLDRVAASDSAKIAIMSSQLGARRGRRGTLGPYGDSKAALNDAFRARSTQWGERGITAIVMHPGWVRTDMGSENAAIDADESAAGIRGVIARMGPAEHGGFYTWDGREHPW